MGRGGAQRRNQVEDVEAWEGSVIRTEAAGVVRSSRDLATEKVAKEGRGML